MRLNRETEKSYMRSDFRSEGDDPSQFIEEQRQEGVP